MDWDQLRHIFESDVEVETFAGPARVKLQRLGLLQVSSGWIVAGDPGVLPLPVPFAHRITPGRYPVYASVATRLQDSDQRVAFGILRLAEEVPVRWEVATLQGRPVAPGEHPEAHGYGVDSGNGAFMDLDAARIVESSGEETLHALNESMAKNEVTTWSWGEIKVDPATELNLIAYTSGDGDGCYPSFWGFGRTGERVALVTDFYVLRGPA